MKLMAFILRVLPNIFVVVKYLFMFGFLRLN